jgi:hypothetical protein
MFGGMSNKSQIWLPIFDQFNDFAEAIVPNQGGRDVTYEIGSA